VEAAEQAARSLFLCATGNSDEGPLLEMRRRAEVLARALDAPVDALLEGCCPAELAVVYEAWADLQAEAQPRQGLRDAIRRGVVLDQPRYLDGLAAFMAQGPSDYYGTPATAITSGQLEYFALLRDAFREMHIDGDGKHVSREWLSREAAD
jgi:hypothetical protein